MPARVSERKLFISIGLFVLAIGSASLALFHPALRGSRWSLFLLVAAFILGRIAVPVFNSSIKKE